MKKNNILCTLAMLIGLPVFSQTLGISAGVKLPKISKGDIYFVYEDESPAPDIIVSEVPLKEKSLALNLAVDYEGPQDPKASYFFARGQFYAGEVIGGDLGLGVGYVLPAGKKLQVLPEVSVLMGICNKPLGTLDVEAAGSVYITVNQTQYDNYEPVNISLQHIYYGIRPGISFKFPVSQKASVRLHAGYLLSLGSSRVSFTGPVDGETEQEFEKLKSRNLYFDVNNRQTQKAPFTANGPEVRLGVYFPL